MVGVPDPRILGMCGIPFDRVLQGESNEPKITEITRGVGEIQRLPVGNVTMQQFSLFQNILFLFSRQRHEQFQ